jgi:hypothetical protein
MARARDDHAVVHPQPTAWRRIQRGVGAVTSRWRRHAFSRCGGGVLSWPRPVARDLKPFTEVWRAYADSVWHRPPPLDPRAHVSFLHKLCVGLHHNPAWRRLNHHERAVWHLQGAAIASLGRGDGDDKSISRVWIWVRRALDLGSVFFLQKSIFGVDPLKQWHCK